MVPEHTRAACGHVSTGFVRGLSGRGTLPCGHRAEELSSQRLEGMRVVALSVGRTNVPCIDDQWPMTSDIIGVTDPWRSSQEPVWG